MKANDDPRLREPDWNATGRPGDARRARFMLALAVPLALFYIVWLLQPGRVGTPVLYGLLISAEIFNLAQATGFWITTARQRRREARAPSGRPRVDVFIPTYDEPVEIVEPTVAAAMALRAADVEVFLLDDGSREEMRALAERHGARWVTREEHVHAKAGNINHALGLTDAPFVAILDCDHVPDERFLEATLGHLECPHTAFVQTPQYYANWRSGPIAAAAWAQQALFFGAIARGKDGREAMFCCGTNVVFRREALEDVGGFPTGSLTEDFELSISLHARAWRSVYVPQVLARGLGPEDMASYVSQQQRWARGCLTGIRAIFRASGVPLGLRVQHALSSLYFLTGWTMLVYMSMPVIRIFTGAQPLGSTSGDAFLIHFAPYFGWALLTVAVMGAGTYTFRAYALAFASFWIHIQATILTLLGRRGTFVVTPKTGETGRQIRPVWPALAVLALLLTACVYGLARDTSPGTMNNVSFALLHVTVLVTGVSAALFPGRGAPAPGDPAAAEPARTGTGRAPLPSSVAGRSARPGTVTATSGATRESLETVT